MNYALSSPWPLPPPFLCPRLFCGSPGLWNASVPGPSRSIFICLPWAMLDLYLTLPRVEAGSITRSEQKTASHLAWLGLFTGQCKNTCLCMCVKVRLFWLAACDEHGWPESIACCCTTPSGIEQTEKTTLFWQFRDVWQDHTPMKGGEERFRGRC